MLTEGQIRKLEGKQPVEMLTCHPGVLRLNFQLQFLTPASVQAEFGEKQGSNPWAPATHVREHR